MYRSFKIIQNSILLPPRTRNCRFSFQYRKMIILHRFSDLVIVIRCCNWSRAQGIINNKHISSGTIQERPKVAETHSRLEDIIFRRCRRDQFHSLICHWADASPLLRLCVSKFFTAAPFSTSFRRNYLSCLSHCSPDFSSVTARVMFIIFSLHSEENHQEKLILSKR